MSGAVKRVAEHLGNTPAVCRSSYIDPRLRDRGAERVQMPFLSAYRRTAVAEAANRPSCIATT